MKIQNLISLCSFISLTLTEVSKHLYSKIALKLLLLGKKTFFFFAILPDKFLIEVLYI